MKPEEVEAVVASLLESNAGDKKNITLIRLFYSCLVGCFFVIIFFADLTASSFIDQMSEDKEQIKTDRSADLAANALAREALNTRMLERDKSLADQLERVTKTQDQTIERLDVLTQRMMEHD